MSNVLEYEDMFRSVYCWGFDEGEEDGMESSHHRRGISPLYAFTVVREACKGLESSETYHDCLQFCSLQETFEFKKPPQSLQISVSSRRRHSNCIQLLDVLIAL